MNVFDVFNHSGIKQDNDFDNLPIDSIQNYINDGYHIAEHSNKEYTENLHGIKLNNQVSKTTLSKGTDSTIEITDIKNQFTHQITVYHTSKTSTKPNGWSIKTTTTTLECTR